MENRAVRRRTVAVIVAVVAIAAVAVVLLKRPANRDAVADSSSDPISVAIAQEPLDPSLQWFEEGDPDGPDSPFRSGVELDAPSSLTLPTRAPDEATTDALLTAGIADSTTNTLPLEEARWTIVVRDANNAPVRDATVFVFVPPREDTGRLSEVHFAGEVNSEGKFFFDLDPPAGAWVSAETESGFALAREIDRTTTLTLGPWAHLILRLETADGQGIPDQKVTFIAPHWRYPATKADASADHVTDDAGEVILSRVLPDRYMFVPGGMDKLGSMHLWEGEKGGSIGPGESRVVRLTRLEGDILDIFVIDHEEQPLSGVDVSWDAGTGRGGPIFTGPDGRTAIEDLPPNTTVRSLYFHKTGYRDEHRANILTVAGELRVMMMPMTGLEFLVQDANSGQPVQSAAVTVYERYGDQNWRNTGGGILGYVTPESAGRVRIDNIPPGLLMVKAVEYGGTSSGQSKGSTGYMEFELNVDAPPPQPIVLLVSEGVPVGGTVLWVGNDEPAVDATVKLRDKLIRDPNAAVLTAQTNAEGLFSFPLVPAGPYDVEVASPQAQGDLTHPLMVEADRAPEPLLLSLLPGGTAVVRAITDDPTEAAEPVQVFFKLSGTQIFVQAKVVPDGVQTETVPLVPGNWEVYGITPQRSQVEQLRTQRFTLASGETKEILLDWSNDPYVTGRLTINGRPWVSGSPMLVALREPNLEMPPSILEQNAPGEYIIRGDAGIRRIAVWPQPADALPTAAVVELKPGGNTAEIDIQTVTADLIVVDSNDREVTDIRERGSLEYGYHVEFPDGARRESWLWWVGSSQSRLTNIPAGRYNVGLTIDGRQAGESGWTDIGPGEQNLIVVRLQEKKRRVFTLETTLPPGTHTYKFFSPPGDWFPDPANPWQTMDGIHINSTVRIPGGAVDTDGVRSEWPAVDDSTGLTIFRVELDTAAEEMWVRGSFNEWGLSDAWKMRMEIPMVKE